MGKDLISLSSANSLPYEEAMVAFSSQNIYSSKGYWEASPALGGMDPTSPKVGQNERLRQASCIAEAGVSLDQTLGNGY